jgi:CheY-like chemotaxis protein
VVLPVLAVRLSDSGAPRVSRRFDRDPLGAADEPSLERLRILVVDDDRDARELVSRLLEEAGATVELAGSAAEAIAKLASSVQDVLISDIGMPEVDGYELIRRVRTHPEEVTARTPAIALTAFARIEDRTKALQAGYQLHIAKPVQVAELVMAVASLARGSGLAPN